MQNQIQIQPGHLYTARETIDYLKVSRQTLWRFEKRGQLIPVRFCRELRFKGESIIKLVSGSAS